MSVPPFPSQDLAKLVLGYLAEEQLMTAYDEFLQASPYLDALRNEYDRIFMTSLKSILAEYRAVKIYVDTCKPFVLRKKLFQCSNLLDVVKFLVNNVDINKILLLDATEKASLEKQNTIITPKQSACELCHSLTLAHCICKSRQADIQQPESASASYVEASLLQTSTETTHLADLPGNHVTTRKKHVKMLEKDCTHQNSSNTSGVQGTDLSAKQSISSHISPEEYLARCESSPVLKSSDNSSLNLNSTIKALDSSKSNQNIEEFNNVLKSVVNRNKTLSSSECPLTQRISNASSFQDFASGVSNGETQNAVYNVPDSSTSENLLNVRAPVRKDIYNDNVKGPPPCQIMLQVSHVNDSIQIQTCRDEISKTLKQPKSVKISKIKPKPVDKKIQIISDVKVGSKYNDKNDDIEKKTLVQHNATSTPLMQLQMQTIMINGTPAYKHTPKTHSYTADEIMAMPTLIVVPASGSSQITTSAHCEPIMTQSSSAVSKESSSPRVLGPLVIDVSPNPTVTNKPVITELPDLDVPKAEDSSLIKTVDGKNNNHTTTTSVPKDNVICKESNTPQVLPPTRKSSSTPRRSSHVRVLDFTTPRRILHETINEQVPSQSSDPPVENVLNSSRNVVTNETAVETIDIKSEIVVVVNEEGNTNDGGSTKENESANKIGNQPKIYDWDADLRALVANEKAVTVSHRKPKSKTSKKKKSTDKDTVNDKSEIKKKTRSRKSPKVKKTKKNNQNTEELDEEPEICNTNDIPCKPNINIICGKNRDKMDCRGSKDDFESTKNESHDKADECIDTPETERLSLQNVIGAKLNISDLLETPYKQALYDIQMETPRFLGTDLTDEPLSDIKIMNIPTPRFLNTPKPAQATPSSYSSRPTDYSSGGSYYKPDDQDYMPITDLMLCPVTSSKEDLSVEKPEEKDSDEKKSRPVRQCTKNVSYYKSSTAVNKTKDTEENADSASLCSEPISINSSFENKGNDSSLKKNTLDKTQSLSRPGTKKRNSSCRKRKSPKDSVAKDKTKSFMKIKPRYTPKKETPSVKNRKKSIPSLHSKGSPYFSPRKRTSSKEKPINTPLIVPVLTKSRRKSSTPRKLKNFNPDSYGHTSPENISNIKPNVNREKAMSNTQDSDTEQLALRWSDDGSQDTKAKDIQTNAVMNETEDLTKIQQFIESSDRKKRVSKTDSPMQANLINAHAGIVNDGNLQRDLMRRGFDFETARIIERDLLDDISLHTDSTKSRMLPISVEILENKKEELLLEKTPETEINITNALQIAQEEMDSDEIELSVHECYEESPNYFVFEHDDTKAISCGPPIKLKDNFTMEICIDDVTMRLRATPFNLTKLDQEPLPVEEIDYSYRETEQAVSSISNMDRLYTPLKDSIKAQCYEIFDSTLTSIDTPLKVNSPTKKASKASVSELVLEKETETKEKSDAKKRKRVRSGSNEPANVSKRTRQDADLLLKTANIQNIDIETVLTKLHGH